MASIAQLECHQGNEAEGSDVKENEATNFTNHITGHNLRCFYLNRISDSFAFIARVTTRC